MKKLLLIAFTLVSGFVLGQRVVVITSVPDNTPDGDLLYLAGEPNGWNPGDADWIFSESGGEYSFELPASTPDVFQGKITRGSWATVEGNATGGFLPNRTFDFTSVDSVFIQVLTWEGEYEPTDLPENLEVFDDAFYMPELDRNRRIRVLLPTDYEETSIDYPVLYMHDGQNLFSDQESFAGEWEIDESMLEFEENGYEGAIIVAIDNGGSLRIDEYTPHTHPVYGGGEGDEYVDFIVNTLKPAIDEAYRTLPGRDHTGIMGSSLGGLISFYAGLKYQDVFSKVGVFSPSFWFNDSIYDFADETGKEAEMKFYFLAGGQESPTLQFEVQAMLSILESEGFDEDELDFVFDPQGQHSEWFWADEYPEAFDWLYISATLSTNESFQSDRHLTLYPNPSDQWIRIAGIPDEEYHWEIFNSLGQSVDRGRVRPKQAIDIQELPKGVYRLRLFVEGYPLVKTFVKFE
jgi:predicted alpha/beta superfamily hydrolase